jgi:hypothetical protein
MNMPKYLVTMYTKTTYAFVVKAPNAKEAKSLAEQQAVADPDHIEDPGEDTLYLDGCAKLHDADDEVDIGDDGEEN